MHKCFKLSMLCYILKLYKCSVFARLLVLVASVCLLVFFLSNVFGGTLNPTLLYSY